ncbi:hypothetical protein C0Q70_17252 [Pomacea canaliculata]|uniref:Uncharacterized protein n=1 Tax=Pomacea canaliculata TaxID=400727 RepID=A0A2T7NS43_POMCA|nr:uncharacterized protein LOC112573269 [Pomacea canaliculata]PVD23976.1 hypothetical protein C0Q70_17252 [Pomacea canaliculata]
MAAGPASSWSDRQRLVPEREQRSSEEQVDWVAGVVSHLALGLALLGLAFAAFGFLYPRDLHRDAGATARENESADEAYMKLSTALDAVIITGMIMIALGGLILAALFTNSVLCDQCRAKKTPSGHQTEAVTSYHSMTAINGAQQLTTSLPPNPPTQSSHRTAAVLDYGTVLSTLQ